MSACVRCVLDRLVEVFFVLCRCEHKRAAVVVCDSSQRARQYTQLLPTTHSQQTILSQHIADGRTAIMRG